MGTRAWVTHTRGNRGRGSSPWQRSEPTKHQRPHRRGAARPTTGSSRIAPTGSSTGSAIVATSRRSTSRDHLVCYVGSSSCCCGGPWQQWSDRRGSTVGGLPLIYFLCNEAICHAFNLVGTGCAALPELAAAAPAPSQAEARQEALAGLAAPSCSPIGALQGRNAARYGLRLNAHNELNALAPAVG
jgi:hypothetical protein